jgi:NAD(P)-dependent dehydrogenase (short-subunit alcohol dehydrogenase family)
VKKKVALVTGAGTGIGKAVAIALTGAGYAVVLAGRRREVLHHAAHEAGPSALAIEADVTQPASVKALFVRAVEVFGRLDLLFNNAGAAAPSTPIEDMTFETWQRLVDTNLTGPFLCTQEAIRIMKAQDPQGGRIINNGSIASETPRPNMVAYTATKHAILGLTRTTALEGRRHNIACGQIDIGNVKTDLGIPMSQGTLQADFSLKPEPTFDVKHVADAVLYMAGLPLDANVLRMTVMATAMPFVGRG